ncbi:hypothetical protein OCOL_001024 [Ordospora colligata]|uniref:Putative 6-phosphogluconolactonase n=1 Tax=Ordospora colligata OC4 TaxID=1354746 RepID=A0A0B2ULQ2_9MICR|nr:putative 6-phosphogluconolactonase [Ordospora colligata OC4]KHN69920.1 putative 6-phosphogluconolactonase [Ordospora colligata OC4]TBU16090.1 putative 6-phosphogluconolactonase [Ordospora colligata]TBU16303.1 putative 6-phosphogluconolactonase [Ordospora colligata]
MSVLFTNDFNEEIYQILRYYSGKCLSLMISGGSILKCLDDCRYEQLDTSKWDIFYSDEREDQEQLNHTAACGFLNRINAKVHPIDTSVPLEKAAIEYANVLNGIVIDVCLLGIGGDGHICSLLPECPELDSLLYVTALEGDFTVSPKRVTITPRYINEKVKELIFVVPGSKEKKIEQPDKSILARINKDYVVILKR